MYHQSDSDAHDNLYAYTILCIGYEGSQKQNIGSNKLYCSTKMIEYAVVTASVVVSS